MKENMYDLLNCVGVHINTQITNIYFSEIRNKIESHRLNRYDAWAQVSSFMFTVPVSVRLLLLA